MVPPCASPAPGLRICKPVPKEDPVVEIYDKHMTTSAFCFLYRLSLSLQITLFFSKRKLGLCFKNTAETSDNFNQFILYLFSDHVYHHISEPSVQHLSDVITHLPGVVCSLIPPEH